MQPEETQKGTIGLAKRKRGWLQNCDQPRTDLGANQTSITAQEFS